jgi:alkaline phosphatase D
MIIRFLHIACQALILGSLSAGAHGAVVVSTFDTDNDGWDAVGDVGWTHAPDFGNPAGSMLGIDTTTGDAWFFRAPAKFLGDQSSLYGTFLEYDIWVSRFNNPQGIVGDVVIRGNNLALRWRDAAPVAQTWTTQRVSLDTTANWEKLVGNTLVPATEADLRWVLADLDLLRIRGEYFSGRDLGYLDNVRLGVQPVPEPASLPLFGVGAVGLATGWGARRRRGKTCG